MRLVLLVAVTLLLHGLQVNAAEIGLNSTPDRDDIIASGQIVEGDSMRVRELIHKTLGDGKIHRFIIHSPGGNVTEAIAIGTLLRNHEFSVFEPVGVSCISACVFAIAGGVSRVLKGKVGLHHPFLPNIQSDNPAAIKVESEGKVAMTAYIGKMGVKEALVDAMYSIQNPNEIRYLNDREMRYYRISTE